MSDGQIACTVLQQDGSSERVTLQQRPSTLAELRRALVAYLADASIELVNVQRPPKTPASARMAKTFQMVIDEMAMPKGLPRNEQATALYRAYHLAAHPATEPERLPVIYGTVVVFDEPVLFV